MSLLTHHNYPIEIKMKNTFFIILKVFIESCAMHYREVERGKKISSRLKSILSLLIVCVASFWVISCSQEPKETPGESKNSAEQVENQNNGRSHLSISEWASCELPEFHKKFTEKYPDKPPQFTFHATDEERYAQVKEGGGFDLIHPCSQFFRFYAEGRLLQPLDTSRIKHWGDLSPALVEAGKFNGKQYFLPYDWGYESLLVRSDKVDKIPESWGDLWDQRYAGHIALIDAADANHIVTSMALGLDPWTTTPGQHIEIRHKLTKIKPNVLAYWSNFEEIKEMVASGDIWVAANVWNDAYASLKEEGVPVKYITPKEGRLGWMCGYAIPRKAEHVDMAYDYLNALLDPDSQAAFGNMYAYGVSSSAALARMDQEKVKMMQLDDTNLKERTIFYKGWTVDQRKGINERWNLIREAKK
ncbi:MAG: extracellular solute-binding protein [Candidatus Electrothrix scaldis]|nr:MAG: extracellular solute-binding protein [Candidatus Electrothrix sp. GW3-3]